MVHTCVRGIEIYQWYVVHAEYDNALMFRSVFRYAAKVRFQDVIAVEKRHFTVWLYPDLGR